MTRHPTMLAALVLLLSACGSKAPEGKESATEAAPQASASAAAVPASTTPLLAGKFTPQDECSVLPGWTEFQASLRSAVKDRNANALAALANPQIKLDFGGGAGRSALIARLGSKDQPSLWQELDQLDGLGCAYDPQTKAASLPWFFEQDLAPQDPFEVLLATGPKVVLRETADGERRPVAELSWILVVPLDQPVAGGAYRKVSVIGHPQTGFVESAQLRSAIDYRLIATRGKSGWQIDAFVAGD